jgi:TonB-linked SusC/RagA family outer membrane protein
MNIKNMNFKDNMLGKRAEKSLNSLSIMKISLFLSIIMVFSTSANNNVYSQIEISIEVEDQPIINVLDNIESQTNLRFIFGSEIYDFKKKISLSVQNAKLDKVIKLLFENKLSYNLNENVVLLSKAIQTSNAPPTDSKEVVEEIVQTIISGNVTDSKGNPLPGASVVEVGTSNGTTTDFDGNFKLAVDNENATLEVSFIGFTTQKVTATANTDLKVVLALDVAGLDEVVLTGYGSQNKRDITSSISVLDLDGIDEKANSNIGQLLQSRSAGVRVVQGTGKPGASPTVFIRGISSLSGNTQPLYVIDGVVSYDTNALDPNNIQDITVLKDASAAGIYGAAGASNGVVLITTKKGKSGNFKVNLNSYTGFANVINKIPLLNNTQLKDYFLDLNPSLSFPNSLLDTTNDWQDLIYTNAQQSGVNVSVSGGGENGSFFVGLGHLDQEGIVVTSQNKRYSLSINLDQNINDWLSFSTHFNYTRSNVKGIPDDMGAKYGGAISSALQTPSFQPIYDENGFYSVSAGGGFGLENPLSYIYSDDNLDVINNIVADANFSIKLPYNLIYKTQIGITLNNNRFSRFRNPTVSSIVNAYNGEGQLDHGERARYILDNTLTYNGTLDKHNLGVVVGNSISEENIITSSQIKRDFASETVNTFNTATVDLTNTSYAGSWSLQSYFARANYTYDDKYSLTTSVRTDGSSRIASANRWGTFKTFSAGWNLSNESFMNDVDFVKNLKIRAGYGETGNLPSGLNDYANILTVFDVSIADGVVSPGVIPSSQRGNTELQWETSEQFNIGLDFSLLNNRVFVSADYYNKKTNNMIFPLNLPVSSGFSTQIVNLDGYIENKGFEIALNAYLIDKADFSWNSSFNISFNDNVVKNIPGNASILTTFLQNLGGNLNITKNGLPLASFWGYNSEGVDPQTGDLVFTDINGDGSITPEDKQVIGNPMPDFTYGFINEFSYKNWDLNVVIDGVSGNEIYNTGKQNLQAMRFFENQSADIVRRWRNPGDITDVPRATTVDSNGNADINSRWIEDGSFLRIRDISLSYNFGQEVLDAVNISGLRLYANLKNWFTFTDYTGYSPEVNRALSGVDQTATTQGVDYGTYPQAKTFSIGLNVEF